MFGQLLQGDNKFKFGQIPSLFSGAITKFGEFLKKPEISPIVQKYIPQLPEFLGKGQSFIQDIGKTATDITKGISGLFSTGKMLGQQIPRLFQK